MGCTISINIADKHDVGEDNVQAILYGRTLCDEPYNFHTSSQMVRNSLLSKTCNDLKPILLYPVGPGGEVGLEKIEGLLLAEPLHADSQVTDSLFHEAVVDEQLAGHGGGLA